MTDVLFTGDTKITESVLKVISHVPTKHLLEIANPDFFAKMKKAGHRPYMRIAFFQSAKGYLEGGCPIGGVVVDKDTGLIVGKGHNTLIQESNPLSHGETGSYRDAGRVDYARTVSYTTLDPCTWCQDSILKLGFDKVVIGDVTTHGHNQKKLEKAGVELIKAEDPRCIALYGEYARTNPSLDFEDWKSISHAQKEGHYKDGHIPERAIITDKGRKLAA